jgi:hypothetical protein
MTSVPWFLAGSPGDVDWARLSDDGSIVAAGTGGGHVYLRRPAGAALRWQHLGAPPGSESASDAAVVSLDPLTVAVVGSATAVGDDIKIWLCRPDDADPWTPLGGPWADSESAAMLADGGRLAVLGPDLVVSSMIQLLPWIRRPLDPDGVWSPMSTASERLALRIAASSSPPQLFAVTTDTGFQRRWLRAAMLENSAWVWVDTGDEVADGEFRLTAGSMLDTDGRLKGCTLVPVADSLLLVVGAGRSWRRIDLGVPPGEPPLGAAVLASRDGMPTVVARSHHNLWSRTPGTPWADHGTTPDEAAVVEPTSAVATASGVRVAGSSWDFDMWTLDIPGNQWTAHGHPAAVTSVGGIYHDLRDDFDGSETQIVFVLDEEGELWDTHCFGSPGGTFNPGDNSWNHHGRPGPTVSIKSIAGTWFAASTPYAFVVGSDGHLWSRTGDPASMFEWSWVDHGAPAGTTISTAVAPGPVGSGDEAPAVHALGRDGRLWMRADLGGTWQWVDRGTPPGQLIFSVAGAAVRPGLRPPMAAVVTNMRHLWLSVPDGANFKWLDLGSPTPSEQIVAGIGVATIVPQAIDIVAVGSPSGGLWHRRASTDGSGAWTSLGRPPGGPIVDGLGILTDPDGHTGIHVGVVGADSQIWSIVAPNGTWDRFDPPADATFRGGRLAMALEHPGYLVIDNTGRLQIGQPF